MTTNSFWRRRSVVLLYAFMCEVGLRKSIRTICLISPVLNWFILTKLSGVLAVFVATLKQLIIVKWLSRRVYQTPTTSCFGWESNLPAVMNWFAVCAVTFLSRCMTLTLINRISPDLKEIVISKPGAIICLVGDLNQLKTDMSEIEWGLRRLFIKLHTETTYWTNFLPTGRTFFVIARWYHHSYQPSKRRCS